MIKTSKSLEFRSQFWTFWNNTSVSCSKTRKDSGFVIFGTQPFQQNNFHEKILIISRRNIFSKILFSIFFENQKISLKNQYKHFQKMQNMGIFPDFSWFCWVFFENNIFEKTFRWQKIIFFHENCFVGKVEFQISRNRCLYVF